MNAEDSMTPDELRKELRRAWDIQYAFLRALRDLPEVPNPRILKWLDMGARWERDSPVGKRMQRQHGLDRIPPVCECESGAGLWKLIRQGILDGTPTLEEAAPLKDDLKPVDL